MPFSMYITALAIISNKRIYMYRYNGNHVSRANIYPTQVGHSQGNAPHVSMNAGDLFV